MDTFKKVYSVLRRVSWVLVITLFVSAYVSFMFILKPLWNLIIWLYEMSNAIGLEVILTAMTISAIFVKTLNILKQKTREGQENE